MDNWSCQSPLLLLQQRAFLLAEIRQFFNQRNVLEVQTPILSSAANSDRQIEVFTTEAIHPQKQQAFLRTSPEFFHKRLLASGSGDIFEVAPVFRRDERTPLHNPEFTLLEWYRLDFDLCQLMEEVDVLFHRLAAQFNLSLKPTIRLSYRELFQQYSDVNPFMMGTDELQQYCLNQGYQGSQLSRSEALDFIFAVVILPQLCDIDGLLIYHFPIEQAALAQANPDEPETCLRFEFLFQGIELANGYQELQDAKLQRQRFEQDLQWRARHQKAVHPIDEYLLAALENGLPACSGVAVGLERLLMCLVQTNSLDDVMGFNALNS